MLAGVLLVEKCLPYLCNLTGRGPQAGENERNLLFFLRAYCFARGGVV